MKLLCVRLLFLLVLLVPVVAVQGELQLHAPSAILIDAKTGVVLYEKNADISLSPASLTKIMTLYMAYQGLAAGRFTYGSPMRVSQKAYYRNQEPGSTIMYLEPGQNPTLYDLMLGLTIASGNDAAVAVAENFSGSVANFVKEMNTLAKQWDLQNIQFVDASGISDGNKVTAREFAIIAQKYLQNFPQAITELHTVKNFVYPRRENWGDARKWHSYFENKVPLLSLYEGADGLKTGHIKEVGYNLVSTAQRDGTRLIGVVLGVDAPGPQTGDSRRTLDMQTLFDYGFSKFETVEIGERILKIAPPVHVFGGRKRQVELYPAKPVFVTVEKGKLPFSLMQVQREDWFLSAPLKENKRVKRMKVKISVFDRDDVVRIEFLPKESIRRAPFLLWLNDCFTYVFKKIFSF